MDCKVSPASSICDYWLISKADVLGMDNLLYDGCCPDMEAILC